MAAENGRAGLTAREREALAAYAAGLGSDAIARRLGVDRAVVQADLKAATLKLGARSLLEAILRALRDGLIGLP